MPAIKWRLVIMGEPCASGTAATREEAVKECMAALRARPDYSSVLALARAGVPVDCRFEDPQPQGE